MWGLLHTQTDIYIYIGTKEIDVYGMPLAVLSRFESKRMYRIQIEAFFYVCIRIATTLFGILFVVSLKANFQKEKAIQ